MVQFAASESVIGRKPVRGIFSVRVNNLGLNFWIAISTMIVWCGITMEPAGSYAFAPRVAGTPAIATSNQPIERAATGSKPIVIFIGGATVKSMRYVKSAYASFSKRHPDTMVRYFDWQERRKIVKLLASSGAAPVTLVGHSYGGHTAAQIAAAASGGRTIDLLITIDPVGRGATGAFLKNVARGSGRWVNVVAVNSRSDGSDLLASLGGKLGEKPKLYADQNIVVNSSHGDFPALLNGGCAAFMTTASC